MDTMTLEPRAGAASDVAVDMAVAGEAAALIVRLPTGTSPGPDRLAAQLAAASPAPLPLVLDLRGIDAEAQPAAVATTAEAAERLGVEWCVVAKRRQLPGGERHVPAAFSTSCDALQALVFARQGYGSGWAA